MGHKVKITCKECGKETEVEDGYNSPDNDDGVKIIPIGCNSWTLIKCDCGSRTKLKDH